MGTLDAHLVAIDAKTGKPLWNVKVADSKAGYSITHAPLVIKDKVLVGMGGGEFGIRGFIAAFDAKTGKEAWRFHTIPAPGEPGSETWRSCPPNPKIAVRSRRLEARRRLGLGHRLLRSGAESDLLGRGQRRAGL